MMNPKPFQRRIAIVLLAIFLPSLMPANLLYANNNGPKAPEAASFEPVDATDMVNLVTGQYSYVLPLLNVPSPEGGYPIALSYHAGIALDQQASWVGLGWNLNPGAINRNVNGYPDDYNASQLNEFFYDQGDEITVNSMSLGYTNGAFSVGLGFNWGSHQALGGQVSVGYGASIEGVGRVGGSLTTGTNGSSIGVNAAFANGLTVGINASDGGGGVSGEIGFDSNGNGFSISTSGDVSMSAGIGGGKAISVNATPNGIGVSFKSSVKGVAGKAGVGLSVSFNNTVSMGDYTTNQSSWMVPVVVPTPIGVFSLSFGQQKFKYWLGKNTNNYVTGPIYYFKGVDNIYKQVYRCHYIGGQVDSGLECGWFTELAGKAFMDINEVSTASGSFSNATTTSNNNLVFPNYDNYSVQAQGLSGNISSTLFENGALFGLDGKENSEGFKLKYEVNGSSGSSLDDKLKFNNKPFFYFENEISTYLNYTNVDPLNFNTLNNYSDILSYGNTSSVDPFSKTRRKTANFIEYYTNEELTNETSLNNLKEQGYLNSSSNLQRGVFPKDGIGAFKITAIDGKTYHYSLPVYNHEVITRTFGVIENNLQESQSYFEKRQLEPYATHWLLTAITGPDFIDNGDGVAGTGDLGYWTSFEYGKWTDAFVWKAPFEKDYIVDEDNPNVKTWIRGRKQIYYLDKIKTRTHTAAFVKSVRNESSSNNWNYSSVTHRDNLEQNSGNYSLKFTVPFQAQLKLEKIILYKNEYEVINKNNNQTNQTTVLAFNNSVKENVQAVYNCKNNVIDINDNWQEQLSTSQKVIDLSYAHLAKYGKVALMLDKVQFNGKSNNVVLPPYKFDYHSRENINSNSVNDGWGYDVNAPYSHSLKEITTPNGAKISIEYESNMCKSIMPHSIEFSNMNPERFKSTLPTYSNVNDLSNKTIVIDVGSNNVYPIPIGKLVNINLIRDYTCFNDKFYYGRYNGTGHVIENLGNGKYKVQFDNDVYWGTDHHGFSSGVHGCDMGAVNFAIAFHGNDFYYHQIKVKMDFDVNDVFVSGGPRVKNIAISGYDKVLNTNYKYGENENGVGYVSYLPYSQNISKEVPYSAELPAPRVMYDNITVVPIDNLGNYLSKTKYKFNVMKEKTPSQIKYGDFYELTKTENNHDNLTSNKKVNLASYLVKDNLASIGQLLEIEAYNSKGQLLSRLKNNYFSMSNIPNQIGVKKESYQSYKTIDYTNNTSSILDKWLVNSTTRITYPSLIKSSSEQSNGYTFTTEFNDYDLISGISKEQILTSSDGKTYKTKVVPAYTKYPQMGSKVDDINNRNMLSQTAATYSYIQDAGDWKVTGVGITTWNNIWSYQDVVGDISSPTNDKEKIWRKHKSFVWNGVKDNNGIFQNYDDTNDNDDDFDWTIGVGSQPVQWKQTSEITLYDHYSMPLEAKDINNNKAATKMDVLNQKVEANGNAAYNEMYYSGAEIFSGGGYWIGQEVRNINGVRTDAKAHTGKYSIATTNNSQFGVFMRNGHRPGKYKISVWAHKDNYLKARLRWYDNDAINTFTFNGEKVFAGDWVLLNHYTDAHYMNNGHAYWYVNSDDNSTVYFDDLMIRPIASSITGYVYNEYDELTHIIGNNGLATRFEYDAAGRLIKTYVEIVDDPANSVIGGFKLKSENKYHYKNL